MKLFNLFSALIALTFLIPAQTFADSTLAPAYGGRVFIDRAADGTMVPKFKLQFGPDGTRTDVSGSNPLPITGTFSGTIATNPAGAISNSSSVGTTPMTFTAPAHASGFLLEAESSNTVNCRYAVGAPASASVGILTEPGRDSGYIPMGADISVYCAAAGQSIGIQWTLSQ